MYLKKEIETNHGIIADCWIINKVQTNWSETNWYTCNWNLSLYLNETAFNNDKLLIDNCTFSFDWFTQEEIDGNTLLAIIWKIQESVMSEPENEDDPEETNLLNSSHSGKIWFQDAIIL